MNWVNTWLCGPGVAQYVIDDIELGPRPAKHWAWGRTAVPRACAGPHALRRLNPTPPPCYPQRPDRQMSLLEVT